MKDGEAACPECLAAMQMQRSRVRLGVFCVLVLLLAAMVAGWLHLHSGPTAPANSTTGLTISVIDVGQGDSILVQFPQGQTMLVDAGVPDEGATVVAYLQQRHVARIDLLVATHPHEDHIGGMKDVLAEFPVGQAWDDGYVLGSKTQEDYLADIKARGIPLSVARAGMTRQMDGVGVEVLAPVRLLEGTDSDANNNSVVLRLSYGAVSALLTGDMEGEERDSVSHWPPCTILKVAHHGSRTGTDAAFLRAVQPSLAVISCGVGNSYGHPHAETLDALRAAHVLVKNTQMDGTVVIATDGRRYSVTCCGKSN